MGWGYTNFSIFGKIFLVIALIFITFWPYIIAILIIAAILFAVKFRTSHQKDDENMEDLL